MTGLPWDVETREEMAERRTQQIPFSHVSIELGHFCSAEFAAGYDALVRRFERVAPWVEAVARLRAAKRRRVSTCFLVDDYFERFSTPAEVLPRLIRAAESQGVAIDYIARESGCVVADGVPVAELMLSRLVAEPAPGNTGVRPPVTVSGWLANGERSPGAADGPAMSGSREWQPPVESGAKGHSIFLDVELWDEHAGSRRYSSPCLAAVWQLLRLGLLRHGGAPVTAPVAVDEFPDDWDQLPAVVRVNPAAQPFSAYSTFSVRGQRFMPLEHAVQTILQQVHVEPVVAAQVRRRSAAEGLQLPEEPTGRIEWLMVADD